MQEGLGGDSQNKSNAVTWRHTASIPFSWLLEQAQKRDVSWTTATAADEGNQAQN